MCTHSQDNLPIRPEPLPISCLKHPAKKHSSSSLPCCLSARACSLHWRPQDAQASACTMQERSGRQDFASGGQPRTKKQKAAATAAHWNVPLPTPKIASGARAAATVAHWNVHLQQRVAHQSPACKQVRCGQLSNKHAGIIPAATHGGTRQKHKRRTCASKSALVLLLPARGWQRIKHPTRASFRPRKPSLQSCRMRPIFK